MYTMVETTYGSDQQSYCFDLLPVDKHQKLKNDAELFNVISKYTDKASYSASYYLNHHDCEPPPAQMYSYDLYPFVISKFNTPFNLPKGNIIFN